ncbi:bifunctional non-homologous end joining protein LigD [Rhizobiales bacterium GAS113]|nr:bifunctional non-homologous end joining protein LigD [Rhizobiales bacterium GAS113]
MTKPVSAQPRSEDRSSIAGIRLTHPDKILFPEAQLTKRDLAAYYAAIGKRMMPHVAGRLISLVRAPDGAGGETFFQRHVGATLPKVFRRVTFKEEEGERRDYMMLADASGLVAAAQFSALEIHIWGSRIDQLEKPDRIVFDLDPDAGLGFAAVREAAFDLRQVLEALGLTSYPMITGGKGVHVVLPIRRKHDWESIGGFASAVAERLAKAEPGRFVASMSKAKRKGKIFIDHFRNRMFATAIAPYSSRAGSAATIACPFSWEELRETQRADAFTIRDASELLKKPDPWHGYFELQQYVDAQVLRAVD